MCSLLQICVQYCIDVAYVVVVVEIFETLKRYVLFIVFNFMVDCIYSYKAY